MKRRVFASMGALAALLAGGSAMARQIPAEIRHGGWSRAPLPEGDLVWHRWPPGSRRRSRWSSPATAPPTRRATAARTRRATAARIRAATATPTRAATATPTRQHELNSSAVAAVAVVVAAATPTSRSRTPRSREVRDGQRVQVGDSACSWGGGRGVPGAPPLQPSSWPRAGGGSMWGIGDRMRGLRGLARDARSGRGTISFLCDPDDLGVIAEPFPAKAYLPDWFRKLPAVDKAGARGQRATARRSSAACRFSMR